MACGVVTTTIPGASHARTHRTPARTAHTAHARRRLLHHPKCFGTDPLALAFRQLLCERMAAWHVYRDVCRHVSRIITNRTVPAAPNPMAFVAAWYPCERACVCVCACSNLHDAEYAGAIVTELPRMKRGLCVCLSE